ncbi:MAG: hypothetical protein AAB513_03470 [Patescibacteria group bacterium]
MKDLIKKKSAWIPLLMIFIIFLGGVFEYLDHGFTPHPDEGIGAHLFQLFTPLQIPIIIYFAFTYIPQNKKTIYISLLQIFFWLTPIVLVFSLGL